MEQTSLCPTISYTYDDLDRVVSETYNDTSRTIRYGYSAEGNLAKIADGTDVYYSKVAHRQGGDFVLDALGGSLKISAIGTSVVTAKNVIVGHSK